MAEPSAQSRTWMRRPMRPPVDLHIDRPHPARIYDWLLGGKTNYPADRKAAEAVAQQLPTVVPSARANRAFMHRVGRYLAAEAGIRQFLDIGTGIPTPPNLHEVVQDVAPSCRVVYADNDPIVLTHSRALHTSDPAGRTAYVQADVTEPDAILGDPEVRETLDLGRPVALTLLLLLHWLPDAKDPHGVVRLLVDALPSGSYLVITHATNDFDPEAWGRIEDDLEEAKSAVTARSKARIARFFDGLDLVEPGLTVPQDWRPDPALVGSPDCLGATDVPIWAGVARKP